MYGMMWLPRADHGQKHDPGDENHSEGPLQKHYCVTNCGACVCFMDIVRGAGAGVELRCRRSVDHHRVGTWHRPTAGEELVGSRMATELMRRDGKHRPLSFTELALRLPKRACPDAQCDDSRFDKSCTARLLVKSMR
jgi:hypothetical protein